MAESAKEKPHLSPSQLNMLARCPMQYKYRYIDGIKVRPGVALTIGSTVHESVEDDLRHKMDNEGVLMEDENVKDNAASRFEANFLKDEPDLGEMEKGTAKDQSVTLSVLHHVALAPMIEPVALEEKLPLILNGFPFDLLGYIDIREYEAIRDTKTKGRTPPKSEIDTDLQFTVYSLLYKKHFGTIPDIHIDCIVKTKKPKAVTISTSRSKAHHQQLIRRIEIASQIIEAGIFAPALPGTWWCSERFCGYWSRCPFGAADAKSF